MASHTAANISCSVSIGYGDTFARADGNSVNRRSGLETPPKSLQNDVRERTKASPSSCASSCHKPRRKALTPRPES